MNPSSKDWGHATSTDLWHWKDHPVAIPATRRDGSIYSGSVVLDQWDVSGLFSDTFSDIAGSTSFNDNVIAFYTSHTSEEETQHIAYSHDGGYSFQQFPGNPVIRIGLRGFRDPKVVYHEPSKSWIMALTIENAVQFYGSQNLTQWKYMSKWAPEYDIGFIECPQLIQIPRRDANGDLISKHWVLVLSTGRGRSNGMSCVKYVVGDFDNQNFRASSEVAIRHYDFGPDLYATAFWHRVPPPSSNDILDPISISWATEVGYAGLTPTDREGWRGAMSGARTHWLNKDFVLCSAPIDTDGLRADQPLVKEMGIRNLVLDYDEDHVVANPAVEFHWKIRTRSDSTSDKDERVTTCGFYSKETGEQMRVRVLVVDRLATITLDRSKTKGWDRSQRIEAVFRKTVAFNGAVEIYGILDRSILEVYINDGAQVGTMIFFANKPFSGMMIRTLKGGLECDFSLTVLKSCWSSEAGAALAENQRVLERDGARGERRMDENEGKEGDWVLI